MKWLDDLASWDWETISRLIAIPGTIIGYFAGETRAHLGDLENEIKKLEIRLNNYCDRACRYLVGSPSPDDQATSALLAFEFHRIVQDIIFLYNEYKVFNKTRLLKHNRIIAKIAVDEKSNDSKVNRRKAELVSRIVGSYIRHLIKEFNRKSRIFRYLKLIKTKD